MTPTPKILSLPIIFLLLAFSACHRGGGRTLEVAYVSAVQANLRDRVAAVYEKAGLVKNGERVEILDHDRRFAKVRTASGSTGWIEQRYLVGQDIYDQIQKLAADNQNDPVQAQGATRNDTNLHVAPGRETEHLYQILSGEKLALLKRGTAEKPATAAPPPKAKAATAKEATPAPPSEDWWLARDSHGRVGWVLARMIDLDVPLEIAQYAEGQRIVAFFALDEVRDKGAQDKEKDKGEDGKDYDGKDKTAVDKKVAEYLTLLTEPKDGLPFDFNQARVFTWNVRKHRYETAYRERVEGILPVTVAQEDFDKEGTLPVFVLRTINGEGKIIERKYKLNTPMVRRVLAPGEEPVRAQPHKLKRRR